MAAVTPKKISDVTMFPVGDGLSFMRRSRLFVLVAIAVKTVAVAMNFVNFIFQLAGAFFSHIADVLTEFGSRFGGYEHGDDGSYQSAAQKGSETICRMFHIRIKF